MSNKLPREFYIDDLKYDGSAFVYTEKVDGLNEDHIHVIEMSAYKALEYDRDRGNQLLQEGYDIVQELTAEIVYLQELLTNRWKEVDASSSLVVYTANSGFEYVSKSDYDELKRENETLRKMSIQNVNDGYDQ